MKIWFHPFEKVFANKIERVQRKRVDFASGMRGVAFSDVQQLITYPPVSSYSYLLIHTHTPSLPLSLSSLSPSLALPFSLPPLLPSFSPSLPLLPPSLLPPSLLFSFPPPSLPLPPSLSPSLLPSLPLPPSLSPSLPPPSLTHQPTATQEKEDDCCRPFC